MTAKKTPNQPPKIPMEDRYQVGELVQIKRYHGDVWEDATVDSVIHGVVSGRFADSTTWTLGAPNSHRIRKHPSHAKPEWKIGDACEVKRADTGKWATTRIGWTDPPYVGGEFDDKSWSRLADDSMLRRPTAAPPDTDPEPALTNLLKTLKENVHG